MRSNELTGAARRLARAPAFSATVVVLLAIGLAATLTLAAAASALLLRPLPYPHGDRLAEVRTYSDRMDASLGFAPGLLDTLASLPEVERVVTWDHSAPLEGDNGELVHVARAGDGLLELLGARPLHGRLLRPEDAGTDAVVLSEDAWRARFGADAGIVGARRRIGETEVEVVGVLADGFHFPRRETSAWRPLDVAALRAGKPYDFGAVQALVRLSPGSSVAALRQSVASRIEPLPELAPMREYMGVRLQVETLREQWASRQQGAIGLAAAAVAAVLVMLVANLAGLWMERSLRRRRELAIRGALGASPARVCAAVTAEVVLLCLVALAAAVSLVPSGLGLLEWLRILDPGTPWLAALDARVVVAGLALTCGVVLALAAAPLAIARRAAASDLGGGAPRSLNLGRGAERLRRALVVLQVALAVTLLAGGALLGRSMLALLEEDPGFEPDGLVMVRIEDRRDDPASSRTRLHELFEAGASLPGVQSASFSDAAPFSGSQSMSTFVDPRAPERPITAQGRIVGPDYFTALGQDMLEGRQFSADDVHPGDPVVVVDALFARKVFGDASAVGQRIGLSNGQGAATVQARIVGVAADVRHHRLDAPPEHGTVYRVSAAPMGNYTSLLLRTARDASALAAMLRPAADRLGLRLADVRAARTVVFASVGDRTPLLTLALGFAGVGLVLSAVGLFALVAFAVERRGSEFGLRMALGATPSALRRLALLDAARLAVPGLALGLAGALVVGRLLASRLHGVAPHDPLSMLAVLAAVGACLLAAASLPAWRASKVDPNQSLRCD